MHPTDEELISHLDGGRAEGVGRHLEAGCRACEERLERLRMLMATMRADRDADPPAPWVARAVALRAPGIAGRTRSLVADWIGGLREELARVITDSLRSPGAPGYAGIRSSGGPRRLRFESESTELDLQIEAGVHARIVTGQFVATRPAPAPVPDAPFLVLSGACEPIRGATDRLGEFSVDAPSTGDLQLRLRREDRIVRFDVPPEPSSGS